MKKIILFVFVFIFTTIFSNVLIPIQKTEAANFPRGCSSAIGYSILTGQPCNGTSIATNMLPGCANPLGYSITTGVACSGTTEALTYLGGCTSVHGYSIETGAPCNGTNTAIFYSSPEVTPGLPTTGSSGISLLNILLLLSSGILIAGSTIYATKQVKIV